MLLNDIEQPIPRFSAYNFRLDRALQRPIDGELSLDNPYDANRDNGGIYTDNNYQFLQGFTYNELLKFWFTIYKLEVDINYSVDSTNVDQEYISATDSYEYSSQDTNVSLQKKIIYHFTKASSAYTTENANPEILLPHERTCQPFNGVNSSNLEYGTTIIPTIEPNVYNEQRTQELYSLTEPRAVKLNNSLSLMLNFSSFNISPNAFTEYYDRNTILLGQTGQEYRDGVLRDPVKYIDFSVTWENSEGEILKDWTDGKIAIGQMGWGGQNEPYQSKQTNSATGSVNFKFISFRCEPV